MINGETLPFGFFVDNDGCVYVGSLDGQVIVTDMNVNEEDGYVYINAGTVNYCKAGKKAFLDYYALAHIPQELAEMFLMSVWPAPVYGNLGTLIHGTLRQEDLLRAFYDEVVRLMRENGDTPSDNPMSVMVRAKKVLEDFDNAPADEVAELSQELFELLNEEYAPPYCYFGAHEGDGADIGFWPLVAQIEELPRINDPSEAGSIKEDHIFVNDHGNVTVYDADGLVLLELV